MTRAATTRDATTRDATHDATTRDATTRNATTRCDARRDDARWRLLSDVNPYSPVAGGCFLNVSSTTAQVRGDATSAPHTSAGERHPSLTGVTNTWYTGIATSRGARTGEAGSSSALLKTYWSRLCFHQSSCSIAVKLFVTSLFQPV